jgi:hypothetical protein
MAALAQTRRDGASDSATPDGTGPCDPGRIARLPGAADGGIIVAIGHADNNSSRESVAGAGQAGQDTIWNKAFEPFQRLISRSGGYWITVGFTVYAMEWRRRRIDPGSDVPYWTLRVSTGAIA